MNAAKEDGKRILMVSNLMSGKGIQKKIEEDFEGIDYTFNPKGLLTHPYYIDWIKESVANHTE